MKSYFRTKHLSSILVSLLFTQSIVFSNSIKKYQSYYYKNFDIVNNAVNSISKQLHEENADPYFIRKIYNIKEGLISVTTKTYYGNYRAKPKFEKQNIHINTSQMNTNKTIKFVYKNTDKNHITQITKGSKKINNTNTKFALNHKTRSKRIFNI